MSNKLNGGEDLGDRTGKRKNIVDNKLVRLR